MFLSDNQVFDRISNLQKSRKSRKAVMVFFYEKAFPCPVVSFPSSCHYHSGRTISLKQKVRSRKPRTKNAWPPLLPHNPFMLSKCVHKGRACIFT